VSTFSTSERGSHVSSARGTEEAEHALATSQAKAEILFGGSSSDSSDTVVVADHGRSTVQGDVRRVPPHGLTLRVCAAHRLCVSVFYVFAIYSVRDGCWFD
jgi:hypothetical protein